MGFFSSLFGSSQPSDESKFVMLRDDGVRAMQMGELPYAEKCFRAALELQDDLQTQGYLAEALLRQQRHADALPLLQSLAASPEKSLEIELLMAQTEGRLGLYTEERATCETICQFHPEEPRALYLRAEADHGLGDDLQAIAHLTQCLTLRPDYRSARLLRARVLAAMRQWNEVLEDADLLLHEVPDDEECLLLRADALAATGQHDRAEADWQAVRAVNPFQTEAVFKLGSLYEATSRWDKALALYDETIELLPDLAEAYRRRGAVKHHLKDEAGAADDLKRALELAPEKAADYDGEYTNVANQMNDRYKRLNPYGF